MSEKQGSLWQRFISKWVNKLSKNVTVQHGVDEYSDSRYHVTTDNAGQLDVVCTELRYAKVNADTHRVVSETSQYKIRCECDTHFAADVRQVLEQERIVPCLSGRSVGAEARRKEAIQAYFDLVRLELKARKAA